MAMKVSWIAQDKKKLQNVLKNITDIAYMRCTFRKRLEEADIKIEEDSQILVSEQNPFYTAKQKTVLYDLKEKKLPLYLGHFARKDGKLELDKWKKIPYDKYEEWFEPDKNESETRRFIRKEIECLDEIDTLKGEV